MESRAVVVVVVMVVFIVVVVVARLMLVPSSEHISQSIANGSLHLAHVKARTKETSSIIYSAGHSQFLSFVE